MHEFRDGPLAVTAGAGYFAFAEPPKKVPRPWYGTFGGGLLCVREPGARIELERVGWRAHTAMARPVAVFPTLRTVDRTTKRTTPIISIGGTPLRPTGDSLPGEYSERIAGAVVTQPCAELQSRPRQEFTELLFVMKVGKNGADVREAWVDYRADGQEYRVMLHDVMIACGHAIRDPDDETGANCR